MNTANYKDHGYCHFLSFFKEEALVELEPVWLKFHDTWLHEQSNSYAQGAINSHSLTSPIHLSS